MFHEEDCLRFHLAVVVIINSLAELEIFKNLYLPML